MLNPDLIADKIEYLPNELPVIRENNISFSYSIPKKATYNGVGSVIVTTMRIICCNELCDDMAKSFEVAFSSIISLEYNSFTFSQSVISIDVATPYYLQKNALVAITKSDKKPLSRVISYIRESYVNNSGCIGLDLYKKIASGVICEAISMDNKDGEIWMQQPVSFIKE